MRQFGRSASALTVVRLLSFALAFVVGVVLARLLGAGGYGVYALAMTGASIAGMVTEFGLPSVLLREVGVARAGGDWAPVVGLLRWGDKVILGLSVAMGVASVAGLWLFSPHTFESDLSVWLLAAALIPFVAIGRMRSFALLGFDRAFASQFPVNVLRPALFLVFAGGCWWLWGRLTPEAAMAAQVAGAAVVMVVMFRLFARHRPAAMSDASPVFRGRAWVAASVPMGAGDGLRVVQAQLGLLVVGSLAGAAQAGVYRVADSTAQATSLVGTIVVTAAMPMFARLWAAGERTQVAGLAGLGAWVTVIGAGLLGLPIALGGPWIFPAVFGADFGGSVAAYWVLWGGAVVAGCFGLTFQVANMIGRHMLTTQGMALTVVTNLILGPLLTLWVGAVGAAASASIASATGLAWCAWRLHRLEHVNSTIFQREGLRSLGLGVEMVRQRFGRRTE